MNVGIITLRDGTPCIVYDEQLPHLIHHVEFSWEDYQLTLIYKLPEGKPKDGKKFEYPLDFPFVKLLEKKKKCAVARVQKGDLFEIQLYSVIFVDGKK